LDGNVGKRIRPASVSLQFRGNARSSVVAMPRFLRIITGDAKALTNGTANANAHWSCTGFESKVQLTDKYPICPTGSKVVRTFALDNCWDGKDIDSANHRDHVAFADAAGNCPAGFVAIPQLTERLTFDVSNLDPANGKFFAVDSFPGQQHAPVTDHADFINVMSDQLMTKAVGCINNGQNC
jgi:hypothetical protein